MSSSARDYPAPYPGAGPAAHEAPVAPHAGTRRLNRAVALCRTANYTRHHLENTVLHAEHLTWTSYDVLHLTVMYRPIDTGVLAGLAHVSKGTVTRAANHLIKRGLLRRHSPQDDRRRAVLTPTVTGWQLNQRLRTQLVDALTELLETPPRLGEPQPGLLRHFITGAEPIRTSKEHS